MAAWLLLLLSSSVVPVTKSDLSCGSCDLKNVTLTFVDNHLQVLDTQQQQHQIPVHHHSHPPHFLANVTRCMGKCEKESGLVCRPTLTSLQTLAVPVPWNLPRWDYSIFSLVFFCLLWFHPQGKLWLSREIMDRDTITTKCTTAPLSKEWIALS